jgi:hypothetical protein
MDIATILSTNYIGSEWTLDGNDYAGLTWLSDTPKPTKEQLESEWAGVQDKIKADAQSKIDTKASAIFKLTKLGLTADEISALKG